MDGEAPRELLVWLAGKHEMSVPPLDAGYEYGLEASPARMEAVTAVRREDLPEQVLAARA